MTSADRTPPGTEWLAADAARVVLAVQARRDVAMTDLFLPSEGRLRDDDRATIARLLAALVDTAERDLRRRLAPAFADRPMLAESLSSTRIAIARPILERAGALRDAALVAVLARRSEEGRLVARLRLARDRSLELEPDLAVAPLDPLADDADPAIRAAAARLAAAERSGRDASGRPVLASAELPGEAQYRLVWRIAAALRDYILASHAVSAAALDPLIARAATAALAGYDEGDTLPALTLALARALHAAGRLDDGLIVGSVAAAFPALAVAALSVRAGIVFAAAWDMACDPDPGRLLLLCRAADLAPPHAADIALRLAADGDDDALVGRLDTYEAGTPERAAAAVALWRFDPIYLDSIVELARSPGR